MIYKNITYIKSFKKKHKEEDSGIVLIERKSTKEPRDLNTLA